MKTQTTNAPTGAPESHTPKWSLTYNPANTRIEICTENQEDKVATVEPQDPQRDGGRSHDLEHEYGVLIAAAPETAAELKETRESRDSWEAEAINLRRLREFDATEIARAKRLNGELLTALNDLVGSVDLSITSGNSVPSRVLASAIRARYIIKIINKGDTL